MHPYRRLLVWQKAHQFAIAVRTGLARHTAPDIAQQAFRSSASVAANIVEGAGSQTSALFARFLGIALASAQETEYLLLLAKDAGQLPGSVHADLHAQGTEIQKMLSALIAAVRRNAASAGSDARHARSPVRSPRRGV